jgi:hypothetical protein
MIAFFLSPEHFPAPLSRGAHEVFLQQGDMINLQKYIMKRSLLSMQ